MMFCSGSLIKREEPVIKTTHLPNDVFEANKDEASSSSGSQAATQSEMCAASEMMLIDTDSGTEIQRD